MQLFDLVFEVVSYLEELFFEFVSAELKAQPV
jgi:hypothetical protein